MKNLRVIMYQKNQMKMAQMKNLVKNLSGSMDQKTQ